MSTELRVEHLLNSVKQLSPVELDEFTQKISRMAATAGEYCR